MTSSIKPSVGRKVWYYHRKDQMNPIDATIVGMTDSQDVVDVMVSEVVIQKGEKRLNIGLDTVRIFDSKPVVDNQYPCVVWMPYQLKAKEQEKEKLRSLAPIIGKRYVSKDGTKVLVRMLANTTKGPEDILVVFQNWDTGIAFTKSLIDWSKEYRPLNG